MPISLDDLSGALCSLLSPFCKTIKSHHVRILLSYQDLKFPVKTWFLGPPCEDYNIALLTK
jgi:hypothetical protein